MKIKVCGNSEPQAIALLQEIPIDYLGLIFVEDSVRAISEQDARQLIAGEIPLVGVFRDSSLEKVSTLVRSLSLSAVQLHGAETPAYVEQLRGRIADGVEIWKALPIAFGTDFSQSEPFEESVDRLLFDTKSKEGSSGGTGEKFDWSLLTLYQGKTPFFLAGGIAPEDLEAIQNISRLHSSFWGIDINSRFEKSPGEKDIEGVRHFVEELKGK